MKSVVKQRASPVQKILVKTARAKAEADINFDSQTEERWVEPSVWETVEWLSEWLRTRENSTDGRFTKQQIYSTRRICGETQWRRHHWCHGTPRVQCENDTESPKRPSDRAHYRAQEELWSKNFVRQSADNVSLLVMEMLLFFMSH